MHDRKHIYARLWEHTDRLGMIKLSQLQMADELGIPYQRLSIIYTEFQKAGYIKIYRHKFQMRNPDDIDWKAA